MRAMILPQVVSLSDIETPLQMADLPMPQPVAGEILVRVTACGVCHTELDEIEGRTAPTQFPIVLGHEVVGRVEQRGAGVTRHRLGDRVGVGWIHSSSGAADENLSPAFRATGRDVHGGYAEFMTVPEDLCVRNSADSFATNKRPRCCVPVPSATEHCGWLS